MTHNWKVSTRTPTRRSLNRVATAAPVLAILAAASCTVTDDAAKSTEQSLETKSQTPADTRELATPPSIGLVAKLRDQYKIAPAKPSVIRRSTGNARPAIGDALAKTIDGVDRLTPTFTAQARDGVKRPAVISYANAADGAFRVSDQESGMQLEARLLGSKQVKATVDSGYVVYRAAWGGGDVVHRPTPAGTEDFVTIAAESDPGSLRYGLTLDPHVAGLRLVADTLEFVDAKGFPRLHVAPPYVVDSAGNKHVAHLSVEGCAVDNDPAPPWDHAVVAPSSSSCTLVVSWSRADIAYPAMVDPSWTTAGSMITGRWQHVAVTYSDGTVVVAGGTDASYNSIQTAEVYNPANDSWAATGSTKDAIQQATGHLVKQASTWQVLLVGGFDGAQALVKSETWDSGSGVWSYTAGAMANGHIGPASAVLANGKVLAAAGMDGTFTAAGWAELYDPQAGTWSSAGSIGNRMYASAALLNTGEVIVFGGENNGFGPLNGVDIYDPKGNAWSSGAPMIGAHAFPAAGVLGSGKLLVAGGLSASANDYGISELYDRSKNTWTKTTGAMTAPRDSAGGVLLGSGKFLVAGGYSTANKAATHDADLYDPSTDTWSNGGTVPGGDRLYPSVNVLANKKVLVASGWDNTKTITSAAVYDMGTNGDQCKANTDCTSGFCVDGVCCSSACAGGPNDCQACSVAAGGSKDGTCTFVSANWVCKSASTSCESDSVCTGSSNACPANPSKPKGTVCNASAGVCEGDATCDGITNVCPAKAPLAKGTVCSAASGSCENAATCDGSAITCPSKTFVSAGTVCNASSGACENDAKCDGQTAACPAKVLVNAGTVCAAASGKCEQDAKCDGKAAACPAKPIVAQGTVCDPSAGPCESDAKCDGQTSVCPAKVLANSGTVCDPAKGKCENDALCDGKVAACPAKTLVAQGTVCDASGGKCQNDAICDGQSYVCPSKTFVAQGTICDPSTGPCEIDAMCDGASVSCGAKRLLAQGMVCKPSMGDCQSDALCDGTTSACPANANVPDGTTCNGGAGQCSGGSCGPLPTPDAGAPDSGSTDDGGVAPDASAPDASADSDGGPANSAAGYSGGCSTNGTSGGGSGSAIAIGFALMMVTRRKRSA